MKFKINLEATIEFDMPDDSTKDEAVASFFEELAYINSGELVKADYDIEEVIEK